jgi:hypothetical protein
MRPIEIFKLLLLATSPLFVQTVEAQTPTISPGADLAPIAFFTTHEWEAQLPDTPDGKKRKIHAVFTWTQNKQAIRISNQWVVDGKPNPYVDGLYAWDPQQKIIVFWYAGADGSLTKGTVKAEGVKLVHEFEQTERDGKTAKYVAKVTPTGETGWRNEIFARSSDGLTPMVDVQYQATK